MSVAAGNAAIPIAGSMRSNASTPEAFLVRACRIIIREGRVRGTYNLTHSEPVRSVVSHSRTVICHCGLTECVKLYVPLTRPSRREPLPPRKSAPVTRGAFSHTYPSARYNLSNIGAIMMVFAFASAASGEKSITYRAIRIA